MPEDNTKLILETVKNSEKRKLIKSDDDDIESALQTKIIQEQNSRTFGMTENFGPLLNKWQTKSETFNPTKSSKSRVNEIIDPSITSGIVSFAVEASERHNRLKPNISDEFLSRQFRGSSVFTDAERIDGRL